jgi:hypothetical protein
MWPWKWRWNVYQICQHGIAVNSRHGDALTKDRALKEIAKAKISIERDDVTMVDE